MLSILGRRKCQPPEMTLARDFESDEGGITESLTNDANQCLRAKRLFNVSLRLVTINSRFLPQSFWMGRRKHLLKTIARRSMG